MVWTIPILLIFLTTLFAYLLRDYLSRDSPPIPSLSRIYRYMKYGLGSTKEEHLSVYQDLVKECGNIFAVPTFVLTPIVHIKSHKLIKEVYKSPLFFGRPNSGVAQLYFGGDARGIGLHDNEKQWSEVRNFTFRKLKEHGAGRYAMDVLSVNEATGLVDNILANYVDTPVCSEELLTPPMINVMWNIICGEGIDEKVPEITKIHKAFSEFAEVRTNLGFIVLVLIAILGSVSTKLVKWVGLLPHVKDARRFFYAYTEMAKSTFVDGKINSFSDAFIDKIKSTTNPESMFYGRTGEENLSATVFELVNAGVGTSVKSLEWTLLYLAVHRDKLMKIHQEIDAVLEGKLPRFEDKARMPYVTAVLMESSRIATILAFGVPRRASQDVVLQGYKIKKDTTIVYNCTDLHHDPEIWGDPEVFRPERFLTADGSSVVKHESLIPFGIGKRSCPGEHLGKHNLFIFLTTLLQRFSVSLDKPISLDSSAVPVGFIPPKHKLRFSNRF